jgi:diguanylate cyclase (GGDEF)-like protein/PAS domain S-box-containing protein
MRMPGLASIIETLSIRHYVYTLIAVILSLVFSLVTYVSWQHYVYEQSEYLSNNYHLRTVLLATRFMEELHGFEARQAGYGTGGHGPARDAGFAGSNNNQLYQLGKHFTELMNLHEMFRSMRDGEDTYMRILHKARRQLERLLEESIGTVTNTNGTVPDRILNSLPALTHSIEQLRRLHTIAYDNLNTRLETRRAQTLRNTYFIGFLALMLGVLLITRILAQIRCLVERQQQTESKLRSSEERFRALASDAPVGIFRVDTDGVWVYANIRCAEIIGLPREACLGQGWKQWLHSKSLERVESSWTRLLEENHPFMEEFCFLHKKGESVWVVCQATPELDGAGNVTGFIGTLTDITARKRAEEDISHRKTELETIFSSLPDIYFRMKKDGTIVDCLAQSISELYVEPASFIGKRMQEVIPPDIGCLYKEHMDIISKKGKPTSFEYELTVNQKTRPYEARLHPLGDTGDVIALVRDITEQRNTDERLQQAAIVYDNTLEGIVVTDREGTITNVNHAFTDITGYRYDEIIGKGSRILNSGRHDPQFFRTMWTRLDEQGHWQGEIWNRRKGGEIFPAWLSINSISDSTGSICNYVAVFSDITEIRRSQDELEHLAQHDVLTDLPNRLLFESRLDHAIHRARRRDEVLSVMFLDLDRFKIVNDSLGHAAGDSLLQKVATRLHSVIREDDTVARMGGDEFTFLLEEASSSGAAKIAEKCIRILKQPFELENREIYLSGSIGISIFPQDGEDVDTLVRNADAAMYKAKGAGRNNYQFYTAELTANALERVSMETHLRRALERNEFRLLYQPQVELASGRLIGVEALLRWQSPELGLVGPNCFIPLLEESGLIIPVGEWVLEMACQQARAWLDMGWSDCSMAVNIAGEQITRSNIVGLVHKILDQTGLPPKRLELEMTETFVMCDPENTIGIFQELRDSGVRVAIDDFGTGHSSLAYLKRLPIDRLKIDRSFIDDIPGDSDDEAITRAIIALGQSLRLDVIAEGVEAREMVDFLVSHGCHYGQGFLFGKPLEADAIQEMLDLDLEITRDAVSS